MKCAICNKEIPAGVVVESKCLEELIAENKRLKDELQQWKDGFEEQKDIDKRFINELQDEMDTKETLHATEGFNLIEGLHNEIVRARETLKIYEETPNGIFAATIIKQQIASAEKVLAGGDIASMIAAIKDLKDIKI